MSWYNTHRASWRTRWGNGKWMPPTFTVFALLSGGLYWWSVDRQEDSASCQSQYNSYVSISATARAKAAEADRNATKAAEDNLDGVVTFVAGLITDPPAEDISEEEKTRIADDYRAAFGRYLTEKARVQALRIEADKTRAENPIPEVPECVSKGQSNGQG